MHLWPSMRIRDSFKLAYLRRVETNLNRMQSEKRAAQREGLLENQDRSEQTEGVKSENDHSSTPKVSPIRACCEMMLLILCCSTCFCCGACTDEDNGRWKVSEWRWILTLGRKWMPVYMLEVRFLVNVSNIYNLFCTAIGIALLSLWCMGQKTVGW